MPTIDIPPEYWTPEQPGYLALVSSASPVAAAIDAELASQHDGISGYAADQLDQELSAVDGDAPQLAESAAQQTSTVVNTPTGAVVAALPAGDGLTNAADGQVYQAAAGAPNVPPAPSGGGIGDSDSTTI